MKYFNTFFSNSLVDCIFSLLFARAGCCDLQICLKFFITVTFSVLVCQSVFSWSAWVFGMCTTASMTATAVNTKCHEGLKRQKIIWLKNTTHTFFIWNWTVPSFYSFPLICASKKHVNEINTRWWQWEWRWMRKMCAFPLHWNCRMYHSKAHIQQYKILENIRKYCAHFRIQICRCRCNVCSAGTSARSS